MAFTIDDVRNAMKTAEIHLAAAPAADGGRLRITWRPAPNTFFLSHERGGEVVSKTNGKTVEAVFAAFEEKAKTRA